MSRCLATLLLTSTLACGAAFALPHPTSVVGSSPASRAVSRTSSTELSLSLSGSAAKSLALSIPRAGGQSSVANIISSATANPVALFDSLLVVLAMGAVGFKTVDRIASSSSSSSSSDAKDAMKEEKPAEVKSLQIKFLAAFWLLRCGYWMSGPYVVPAYKSKVFGGVEASMGLVSKIFLSGFAATAIVSSCGHALVHSTSNFLDE